MTVYAQANVVALLDNNGSVVVKYKYDAWGNCKVLNADGSEIADSNHIGILNPFRYRSYYYDTGIGLYFLKTRYYDPEVGRFMTIDDISYLDPESINGLNLYAYCFNNPVMFTDRYGCTAWWEWLIAGVIVAGLIVGAVFTGGTLVGAVLAGAAIGAGMSLGTQALSGELNWGQFALDIGVGAITGLIGGSGVSQCISTILGGVIGAGSNLASQLISGVSWDQISVMQILVAGAIGAASGFIGGAGARNKAAINQGKGVQNATAKLNKVVRRIANGTRYKSLTTAQTAFTNAMNGLTTAIQSQMNNMFSTAMISYGVSTAASSGIDAWFDANEYWFF